MKSRQFLEFVSFQFITVTWDMLDQYSIVDSDSVFEKRCHTPIPGPTRLADPNRVWGARPYTRTLYLFFFF